MHSCILQQKSERSYGWYMEEKERKERTCKQLKNIPFGGLIQNSSIFFGFEPREELGIHFDRIVSCLVDFVGVLQVEYLRSSQGVSILNVAFGKRSTGEAITEDFRNEG